MKKMEPSQMEFFRFGLISPLLPISENGKLNEKIQEQASKLWTLPDGRLRKFGFSTIEAWYYAYNRDGLNALKDKQRKDKGSYRAIDALLSDEVDAILDKHPVLTTANIIELLKDKKFVIDNSPSNTTLYRYISDQRPKNDKNSAKERRAFEAPHAASLWQTDVMYGPYITVKGKNHRCHKQQTYLVAIIDDHSRLCCHAEFYLEQSIGSIVDTFKKACQKRGVPERLYCDHGKVFTTSQLTRIGALISTVILHPEVGDPAARGKVERFFRTVRDSFLNKLLNLEPPKNLLQLNEKFSAWVETSYNNKHHSGINQIPMQKWLLSAHNVRLLPLNENIDLAFMLEVTRKVKKDGTFSLNSIIFEITSSLAGKSIHIRYSPFDLSRAYVYCENEFFGAATVLSKSDNNNRPRK